MFPLMLQTNPEDYFDDSIYDELELPDVLIATGPTKEVRVHAPFSSPCISINIVLT